MKWLRKPAGDPLAVSMSGVKLGDRLLVAGASDTALVAALATKVGLTGRACLVETSDAARDRAASRVEQEGALVEPFTAPFTALPFEADAFDVVVLRNVLPAQPAEARQDVVAEVRRVIRPGGRCLVIDDSPRGGLARLFGGNQPATGYAEGGATAVLNAAGFRGARMLADREGFSFVEGVKPGTAAEPGSQG